MPRVARFWDASSRFGQPPLGKQPGMCSENSGLRRNQRTGPSVAVKPGGMDLNPASEVYCALSGSMSSIARQSDPETHPFP